MGRSKSQTTIKRELEKDLLKLAESYGVSDNALFKTLMKQYVEQREIINKINLNILEGDCLVSKEYVKGRENVYVNPLIKELPKHSDSANKTAAMILELIKSVGKEPEDNTDSLTEFLNV